MITIYGTKICPDCVNCHKAFTAAGKEFVFKDFSECTQNIKDFLKLRDTLPLFDPIREAGKIGIPCLVLPDGTVTFDWESQL